MGASHPLQRLLLGVPSSQAPGRLLPQTQERREKAVSEGKCLPGPPCFLISRSRPPWGSVTVGLAFISLPKLGGGGGRRGGAPEAEPGSEPWAVASLRGLWSPLWSGLEHWEASGGLRGVGRKEAKPPPAPACGGRELEPPRRGTRVHGGRPGARALSGGTNTAEQKIGVQFAVQPAPRQAPLVSS